MFAGNVTLIPCVANVVRLAEPKNWLQELSLKSCTVTILLGEVPNIQGCVTDLDGDSGIVCKNVGLEAAAVE